MSDRDELTDYESDIKEYTDFIHAGIDYRIEKIIALARADERQLIAEAMLSEEAVEAVAYCGELFPGWAKDTMTKEHRDASIGHARQQVNAALAAAGITGAGQEGASNE